MSRRSNALAALMGAAGVAHFTSPGYFREMVPARVPTAPAVGGGGGLLDLGAAALLVFPRTRRLGGRATAAPIAAYLPVHLDAARHARGATVLYRGPVGATARIVVNLGYIAWALAVAREPTDRARRRGGERRPEQGRGLRDDRGGAAGR